jgi:hypothetical protein
MSRRVGAASVGAERPAVEGTTQPVAVDPALREIGAQVRTACIDRMRRALAIPVEHDAAAAEVRRAQHARSERSRSRERVPRLCDDLAIGEHLVRHDAVAGCRRPSTTQSQV